MNRSYTDWMKAIAEMQRQYKELYLILRHDIDFDIVTARRMMEIEHEHGLQSVIYVDVHDPSYTIQDIVSLYKDFSPLGFKFGIHINVAYDYDAPGECWKQYTQDLDLLKQAGIVIHSCAGHMYSERMVPIPQYTNINVEKKSDDGWPYTPKSFSGTFFETKRIKRINDSGGHMFTDIIDWLKNYVSRDEKSYITTHPVHFYCSGNDVIYGKEMGSVAALTEKTLEQAHESVCHKLTSYLSAPLTQQPHQVIAIEVLQKILEKDYRKLYTVVDAGCGIGMIAAFMFALNNCKYIGFDYEPKWIEAGREMYQQINYAPDLRVADIYKDEIPGDILVHLGYEDCPTDYNKLLEICRKYKIVLMTIINEDKHESSRARGKWYQYIGEKAFENLMQPYFNTVIKNPYVAGRVFYWLERK